MEYRDELERTYQELINALNECRGGILSDELVVREIAEKADEFSDLIDDELAQEFFSRLLKMSVWCYIARRNNGDFYLDRYLEDVFSTCINTLWDVAADFYEYKKDVLDNE